MKILKYKSMIINIIGYLFILSGLSQLFSNFMTGLIMAGLGFVMLSSFTKVMEHYNISISNKKRIIIGIVLFCLIGLTAPASSKINGANNKDNIAIVDKEAEEQSKKEAEEKKKEQEAKAQAKLEAEKIAQEQEAAEKARQAQELEQQRQAQAAQEAAILQQQREEQAAQEARNQAAVQARDNSPIAQSYIANVNTKKFHQSSCSYLPEQHNQRTFSSRNEAINSGYVPCKKCNP